MKMEKRFLREKVQRKILITCIGIGMIASLLTGCGSKGSDSSTYSTEETMAVADQSGVETKSTDAGIVAQEPATNEMAKTDATATEGTQATDATTATNEAALSNRKLIKNVSLNVETQDYDSLYATINEKVKGLGGYVEYLNTGLNESYSSEGNTHYASITARIPVEQLDSFVNQVDSISNITSRNEYVEDVTLQYIDMESHKKMLLAEQDSLLKLLENAEKIEDIIALESRLSDIRYQIESMESQLRTYDNLVSYSTVTISIMEVERFTPAEEKGTWEKIKTGFTENMYRVGNGFKNFGIGFVIRIPFIIIWVVIIVIAILVIRILIKQKNKRAAKKAMTNQIPPKPEIKIDMQSK